jgi:hypothetical protein
MLKECPWAQENNFEGGKIGVIKDAFRKWKIMLIGLDIIEAAVRQGRGLSEDLETFIDRKIGDIKMSDLVPADPN